MLKAKFFRDSLFNLVVGLALEYVVFVAIVVTFGQQNPLGSAILAIGTLYAFRFGDFVIRSLVSIPAYYIAKKRMVNAMVLELYQNNVPPRNDLVGGGGYEYMQDLANSRDIPEPVRRYLDRFLGTLDGIKASGKVMGFLRMNAVLDAAIERYVGESNARGQGARPD